MRESSGSTGQHTVRLKCNHVHRVGIKRSSPSLLGSLRSIYINLPSLRFLRHNIFTVSRFLLWLLRCFLIQCLMRCCFSLFLFLPCLISCLIPFHYFFLYCLVFSFLFFQVIFPSFFFFSTSRFTFPTIYLPFPCASILSFIPAYPFFPSHAPRSHTTL